MTQLPESFLTRIKEQLQDEASAFLASYETSCRPSLRLNTNKATFESLTTAGPDLAEQIPWCTSGYYYDEALRPGKHPFHEAGAYYIQEASAMAPAALLNAQPGEWILDLCAAPGGKSTQIADAMQGQGLLVSNEIHPTRARILSENMERMGVINSIVTNENPLRLKTFFPEWFDAICVDAPCSGEGMFRKHPEAASEWSEENVRICADRQDEILDCAADMLAPGGRMVYSTCTFAPRENEGSMYRFLKRHPEFKICSVDMPWFSPAKPEWADADPEDTIADQISHAFRLWPHLLEGEGHFAALLVKEGELPSHAYRSKLIHQEKGQKEKTFPEWTSFQKQTLRKPFTGTYITFKDQLYLLPVDAPALKGLKVLRPGLHLGTLLKNRFEPGHALALALKSEDTVQTADLTIEEAIHYINGETFPWEGSKGWTLVTVCGMSLGWGKCDGRTMKNHYPKGLRKQL